MHNGQPPTLAAVLQRVGDITLRVVSRSPQLNRPVSGVEIYDPRTPLDAAPDRVLLGVGVDPSTAASLELVASAKRAGCTAVVVRTDDAIPEDLVVAARRLEILLLTSSTAVSWVRLATMLHMSVGAGASARIAVHPLGDLFSFVNALATELDGAVTLVDADSRVMAYSSLAGDLDKPRKLTILGRQVPARFMDVLHRLGVLEQLAATDDIVHVPAMPELALQPRVAVSVRAAGELLGFLWVAEAGEPLVPGANGSCARRRTPQLFTSAEGA